MELLTQNLRSRSSSQKIIQKTWTKEQDSSILDNKEFQLFKKFGNRTNSYLLMGDHFKKYFNKKCEGQISYLENHSSLIIASEPMALEGKKVECLKELIFSKIQNRVAIFPISKKLATDLKNELEFCVWHIGHEPIFHLKKYFQCEELSVSNQQHYLMPYPLARALRKRGGVVEELFLKDIPEALPQLKSIVNNWSQIKNFPLLSFLNTPLNFDHSSMEESFFHGKRMFVLRDKGIITSFLTMVPVSQDEKIVAYYFNDILRGEKSRAGSTELLILETMHTLLLEGEIDEVRLGICPLYGIFDGEKDAVLLQRIFHQNRLGYDFKLLSQFKLKLNPTELRPLYFASSSPHFRYALMDVFFAHYPKGLWNFLKQVGDLKIQNFYGTLKPFAQNSLSQLTQTEKINVKNSILPVVLRLKGTLGLSMFFLVLHGVKSSSEFGFNIFQQVYFNPSTMNLEGILIAPFFHNHHFHYVGDQLSFLVFGAAVEWVLGFKLFLIITGLGLWLSNPLASGVIYLCKSLFPHNLFSQFLLEKDYGMSNGVFSLIGAFGQMISNSFWIYMPFILYGVYIMVQRESLLAVHHLIALIMGVIVIKLYSKKSHSPSSEQIFCDKSVRKPKSNS